MSYACFTEAKHDLIGFVWVAEQFVVIEFSRGNGILCAYFREDHPQHAERGGNRITPTFNGELYDVLGIEVLRCRRKARSSGVLNPLIDGQNRDIPRPPRVGRG